MKQITFNPHNEPYYSEDFIKGFNCGAERQFEADKADRPQGEWIEESRYDDEEWISHRADFYKCSICGKRVNLFQMRSYRFCPNCGAKMKGVDDD